ncbi:hypothetical protein L1987_22978 [Smallanthus sonchifolius]|uniref:Uncharacterized protein n=1 Tax=Smallanthus sonchifolius TaxID=185202 RepID=A0ACB9IH91_9ASTR|nr:hypothetical protein L1987_22978 [Smallanthus sonchifolius]
MSFMALCTLSSCCRVFCSMKLLLSQSGKKPWQLLTVLYYTQLKDTRFTQGMTWYYAACTVCRWQWIKVRTDGPAQPMEALTCQTSCFVYLQPSLTRPGPQPSQFLTQSQNNCLKKKHQIW